jgi:uncharacterized protein YndB with AHSA1/START domain
MKKARTLTITTPTERTIRMMRVFHASRHLVWDALTKPELVKRWLYGPDGWSLAVCEIDLRVGGKYRYVWRRDTGKEMGMGGVFREVTPPERLVQTELFDVAWYPGEAVGTFVLTEESGKTTLTQTMEYESRQARDGVLEMPLDEGMEASWDRLAEVVGSRQSAGG